MSTIFTELNKDIEEILIDETELCALVERVASDVTAYYTEHPVKKKLLVVGILKGSIQFMSDIIRHLDMPLEIEFIKVSSYGNSTKSSGNIVFKLGIDDEVLKDADVLIIEDILDSGRTLSNVIEYFKTKSVASVKLCTLLDKPERHAVKVHIDFCGQVVPDKFVVGYGLDFAEKYRNLPYIGVLRPELYE